MSEAINPLEREGCWLCAGCGEVETTRASDDKRETVGCPACIQNDLEWKLAKKQKEVEALAAYAERLSSALEKMLEEFTGEYELLCEQRAVDEGYAALSEAPTTSLASLIAEKQAEGAVLVAEKAWQRTDWDSIGSCPKEWAANHATLLGNELRRQAEGGD